MPEILECVAEIFRDLKEPEEDIRFQPVFYGSIHPGVFADISVNLHDWDDVSGVDYILPHSVPYNVFSLNDYLKVNYY